MPFTRISYEKVWTKSEDFPTYEGNETKVREDMQYHPDAVKNFINDTMLPELEGSGGAGMIGDGHAGTVEKSLDEVYQTLSTHEQGLRDLAGGESPEAVRAAKVEFTADGWVENEGTGLHELRILQAQHKRLNDAFGFKLQHLVDGVYRTNTWAVAESDVGYDSETQDVVLTSGVVYAGAITFYGV